MPRSRPFQWNSEVRPDSDSVFQDVVRDDDEPAVVAATELVRSRAVTTQDLHQAPFTRLSEPLLSAVRDDAFRSGTYREPLDHRHRRAQALRTACVARLNQLGPKSEAADDKFCNASREFVLLSLISPQLVLSVVCEWAARQSIPGRVAAACQVISDLGNVSAYQTSEHEPGILVMWLRDAFSLCSSAAQKNEQSRLCSLLSQLLISRYSSGVALVKVCSCLQYIVNPLLAEDSAGIGYAIIKSCAVASNGNNRIFLELHREVVLFTVKLLVINCSFEKRWSGKMHLVEGAREGLGVLMRNLSSAMAIAVLSNFRTFAPWRVAWQVRDFPHDVQAALEGSRQLSQVLACSETEQKHLPLRQCEICILFFTSSIEHWEEGQVLLKAWDRSGVQSDIADRSQIREIWLTALARQMPLLTTVEMTTLFTNVLHGFLPRALFRHQCQMHPRTLCVGCEKWCCFMAFARLGIRALMLLLSSTEVCEAVSSDEFASLRVLRALCSVFVTLTALRQEMLPPAFVCASLFTELHLMVSQCNANHYSYILKNDEITDVLTMTLLQIARNFTMRDQQDDLAQVQHLETMRRTVHMSSESNQLCNRISDAVLPILSSVRSEGL